MQLFLIHSHIMTNAAIPTIIEKLQENNDPLRALPPPDHYLLVAWEASSIPWKVCFRVYRKKMTMVFVTSGLWWESAGYEHISEFPHVSLRST